jgi:hypothetical protein
MHRRLNVIASTCLTWLVLVVGVLAAPVRVTRPAEKKDALPEVPTIRELPSVPAPPTQEELAQLLETIRVRLVESERLVKAENEQRRLRTVESERLEKAASEQLRQQLLDQLNHRPEALANMQRLGNPRFAERESAQRRLAELGPAAWEVVRVGMSDRDAEIARRCEELQKHLRGPELAAFEIGAIDWPGPAGKRFREIVGESEAARKLFKTMMADHQRAAMVERAVSGQRPLDRLYISEMQRLQLAGEAEDEAHTGGGQANYLRRCREAVPPGDVTAVLFLGSLSKLSESNDPEGVQQVLRASFLDLSRGPMKEPTHKLFAAWLGHRSNPSAINAGLNAALYADVPEGITVARQATANDDAPAALRATALTVLGNHGTLADLAIMSACRTDDRMVSEFFRTTEANRALKVCDMAAAMSVRLRGRSPDEFGFSTVSRVGFWFGDARPPFATVKPYFESEKQKSAQNATWDWLDKQPGTPKPKTR